MKLIKTNPKVEKKINKFKSLKFLKIRKFQ